MLEYYVLGHRGWAAEAPENTLSSFRLALEDPQAELFECDIQMSKDGELVVIHDFTLERTSNGKGLVAEHTLAELRALDFGSGFHPRFAGERIPLFSELLELVNGKKRLVVEIKETAGLYPDIQEKLLEAIADYPADTLMIESFNHHLMRRLKRAAPELCTGIIVHDDIALLAEELEETRSNFAAIFFGNLNQRVLDDMARRDVEVIAWTLNQPWQFDRIKNLNGRLYVASDHPGMAYRELGSEGYRRSS